MRLKIATVVRNIGHEIVELFSPRGDFAGTPFRMRFWPFTIIQSFSGIIPLSLFIVHGPQQFRFYALLYLLFKITVGALLSGFIVTRFYPVLINEKGLRARNFWALARRLEWEDVERVRPIRWLMVMPILRVSSSKFSQEIWLPLFLENQHEFVEIVRQKVPRGNPLREYFE